MAGERKCVAEANCQRVGWLDSSTETWRPWLDGLKYLCLEIVYSGCFRAFLYWGGTSLRFEPLWFAKALVFVMEIF